MNNRRMKKGIKMSFIRTARENGDTKHDARRLFKGVRRLKWKQDMEERIKQKELWKRRKTQ